MAAAEAVPFVAPPSLAVTLEVPNRGSVRGLGMRAGVTLSVGGGFHRKTTLLKAVELGVYNKVRQSSYKYTTYKFGRPSTHLGLALHQA